MKGILLEDYDSKINKYFYEKGQEVDVTELEVFSEDSYAVYRYGGIDWIPKSIVEVEEYSTFINGKYIKIGLDEDLKYALEILDKEQRKLRSVKHNRENAGVGAEKVTNDIRLIESAKLKIIKGKL